MHHFLSALQEHQLCFRAPSLSQIWASLKNQTADQRSGLNRAPWWPFAPTIPGITGDIYSSKKFDVFE